jgi:hypothetical protein
MSASTPFTLPLIALARSHKKRVSAQDLYCALAQRYMLTTSTHTIHAIWAFSHLPPTLQAYCRPHLQDFAANHRAVFGNDIGALRPEHITKTLRKMYVMLYSFDAGGDTLYGARFAVVDPDSDSRDPAILTLGRFWLSDLEALAWCSYFIDHAAEHSSDSSVR